jgi:serine/threonine-protein kinase RsbW
MATLTMPENAAAKPQPILTLPGRLDALRQLVPWVDALAAERAIPPNTVFAIHLCLEEAISNVIRHGYGGNTDQPVTVEFAADGTGELAFTIEDHAPPFDPLAAQEPHRSVPGSIDQIPLGGQGIRLLRRFAGSLTYQRVDGANRLRIAFPARV